MAARFLPLVGMFLFFGVGFFWRAWLQRRRHGHWGIMLFYSTRWDQRVRDILFVVLLLAATTQALAVAVDPAILSPLYLFAPPADGAQAAAGAFLLLGGAALMLTAQLHLGASWRIGIQEGARPGLVTDGLYRFARNPIFLGMFLILAGMVLLQPTWISALALVVGITCVRSQVIEEEDYLMAAYGNAYLQYAQRVGRFVPGLGRR